MTRSIKFRVWDGKEMLFKGTCSYLLDLNGIIWGQSCGEIEDAPGNCVLMRFTGLLDKNGKEIWEGDIMQGYMDWEKGVVKFGEYAVSHIGDDGTTEGHEANGWYLEFGNEQEDLNQFLEVIGNVWEHPSLLKEKK